MFEGRPQLVVFNASHTPDLEVAQAAHISGFLPRSVPEGQLE